MISLDFNDDIDDVVAAVGSVDVDDDVIVVVVVETVELMIFTSRILVGGLGLVIAWGLSG